MKHPKYLFIASYATPKNHFDGEVNKSLAVLECLRSVGKVKAVNLQNKKLQLFAMMRFVFLVLFFRFDRVFICKAPTGGSRILHILRKLHIPSDKIVFYSYGLGLRGGYQARVEKSAILYAGCLLVESPEVRQDLLNFGCSRVLVFPCIKKVYPMTVPPFAEKKVLDLLFFSRVVKEKGVFDAINSVIRLNSNGLRFTLTIAGKGDQPETEAQVKELATKYPFIHFLGSEFSISGYDSYVRFSKFDLQVFLTSYFHECAPGSVVDSFIAGVPVLSTKFSCYQDMLSTESAYFVDSLNPSEVDACLEGIYHDQPSLYKKRAVCLKLAQNYSYEAFTRFLENNKLL